jgi:hypothetical protein
MRKTTADQHPRGALHVSRIPPEPKKNSFLRCSAYLWNTAGAKTRQVALWEIPLSAEIHHAGANCSAGNPPPRVNHGLTRTRTDANFEKI